MDAPPRTSASSPLPEETRIADAVRAARRDVRRLRVRGGGTSAVPAGDGATDLSVAALRGVLDLRPVDLVLTVLAGTPLADVTGALREVGRRLPLEPWAPPGATVGGAVAAAADGLVARDGARWRDCVLGVTAVLGTGELVSVGAAVVKSVAGYDITKALVGSRGTFAVLTRLHLRLDAVPAASVVLTSPLLERRDVAAIVAALDALPWPVAGIVVVPEGAPGGCRLHARFDGAVAAVAAAALRLESAGFLPAVDGTALWAGLTAHAAEPAPVGRVRRVAPCSRRDPFARRDAVGRASASAHDGANPGDGWVADLLRGRVTWLDPAPAPAPDPATVALFERLRRAFDPDAVLAPGRGFGAP
jgi:glycolate oxidase FAD binding subunit